MNKIVISASEYKIYGFEKDGSHIITPHYQPKNFEGNTILWFLPADKTGNSRMIECGNYTVKTRQGRATINFDSDFSEKA